MMKINSLSRATCPKCHSTDTLEQATTINGRDALRCTACGQAYAHRAMDTQAVSRGLSSEERPSSLSLFEVSQAGQPDDRRTVRPKSMPAKEARSACGSAPPQPVPAELLNHPDYEVRRELARGGMVVLYLAHNNLMGRDEVLKVIGRHIIEKPGVLDRFLREIRAVARLVHPNIVAAYSAFRSDESLVFAMEYVEGYDLSKLVKAIGPLSVAQATSFIHQAALGLQHAHEQGMVHRDIKPGNLMLSRRGDRAIIKVLDFGLSKASRENNIDELGMVRADPSQQFASDLTVAGQMLGTPDFIAPVQIDDAQSADIRADIYSLGCTLHYLLSGSPPFQE